MIEFFGGPLDGETCDDGEAVPEFRIPLPMLHHFRKDDPEDAPPFLIQERMGVYRLAHEGYYWQGER